MSLALTLLASPALAEVCDKARPGWDGSPATMFTEAWGLFLSPIGLFLSAALATAVLFRHAMGTALVALMWSFFITFLVLPDKTGLTAQAMQEGCVATPALFIALSAAICGAAVYITFRREKRL